MAKKDEMTQHKTAHIAPFGLRMQPELRSQVEAAARLSGRSLNAEICSRLQESLSPAKVAEPSGEHSLHHSLFSRKEKGKSELEQLLDNQSDSIVEKLAKMLKQ